MMYAVFLGLHIIGALLSVCSVLYAGYLLLWGRDKDFYVAALAIGILAGFETVTGVLLSVSSPQISMVSLCDEIALYLSVLFAVEAALFIRMRKQSLAFPLVSATSPVLAGVVAVLGALAFGV